MEKEIKELTDKLYFDLPFWKRWRVRKYYDSNNWDVTKEYRKCYEMAVRMIDEKNYWIKKTNQPK